MGGGPRLIRWDLDRAAVLGRSQTIGGLKLPLYGVCQHHCSCICGQPLINHLVQKGVLPRTRYSILTHPQHRIEVLVLVQTLLCNMPSHQHPFDFEIFGELHEPGASATDDHPIGIEGLTPALPLLPVPTSVSYHKTGRREPAGQSMAPRRSSHVEAVTVSAFFAKMRNKSSLITTKVAF